MQTNQTVVVPDGRSGELSTILLVLCGRPLSKTQTLGDLRSTNHMSLLLFSCNKSAIFMSLQKFVQLHPETGLLKKKKRIRIIADCAFRC